MRLDCQCNQTINLLSRPEYFRLQSNVDDGQLRLADTFTSPYLVSIKRSQASVPILNFEFTKGSVDLSSIQVGSGSFEFNVYITLNTIVGQNTIGPIRSSQGSLRQCFFGIQNIKLELFGMPVSNVEQTFPIHLKVCENTLREFVTDIRKPFILK